jgi:DNA primase
LSDVDEVKARLNIVDVIGGYVPLQKAGRTFKAPCPFHQEKTPSFVVSPERQSWHCFGACATGGDVISFVMKREGMEFREALGLLAGRAGVQLREKRVSPEQKQARERHYDANEAAAAYFQSLLSTGAGSGAMRYLEGRGLDAATIADFGLGFSLDAWDSCRDHLKAKEFTDREILDAGLAVQGDNSVYDRFRGRLMFPIWDSRGRVCGFGGRGLGEDATPKYLNTPQTGLFDKSGTLYALHKATDPIRAEGQVVIVEGYMDVIAAHQHGYRNVVAQMGTALTERQFALVKRLTERVILVLDTDAAGQAAMHRAAVGFAQNERVSGDAEAFKQHLPEELQTSGSFYVALLPSGKDPDELIRGDPEVWKATIAGARPYIDFWLEYAATNAELATPQGKANAAAEMMQIVRVIDDPVIRAHYLQKVSRLAQVPEAELAPMVRPRQRARVTSPVRRPGVPGDAGIAGDDLLVALLVRFPALRSGAGMVTDGLLWDSRARELLAQLAGERDVAEIKRNAGPELTEYLERLIIMELPFSTESDASNALEDCIRKLERRRLQAEKQSTAARIADLQELTMSSEGGETGLNSDAQAELESLIERDMEIGRMLHGRNRTGAAAP